MVFVPSFLFFISCNQIRKSFEDTFKSSEENQENSIKNETARDENATRQSDKRTSSAETIADVPQNFLADRDALMKAQKQLHEIPSFVNKQLHACSSIHFYDDGRVNITLQDPNTLEHIDEYDYRDGDWHNPRPVIYRDFQEINSNLYPLKSVSFEAVCRFYRQLMEKSLAIQGAQPITHIYYSPGTPPEKGNWRASVSGTRERYSAKADVSGNIIEFERS